MGSLDLDDLEKSDLGQMGLLPWSTDGDGEGEDRGEEESEDEGVGEEGEDSDCESTSGLEGRLVEARVTGFAKQKPGDKGIRGGDFAYVVEVVWDDGRCSIVKRTFNDFCNLHFSLLDKFVDLADNDSPCKLNFTLPARGDGADDNIAIAEARELQLNKYVQDLLSLPKKVSGSSTVLTFFESRGSDPRPYTEDDLSDFQFSDQYMLCWL